MKEREVGGEGREVRGEPLSLPLSYKYWQTACSNEYVLENYQLSQWNYLGFFGVTEDQAKYYHFNVLLFGRSTAAYLFIKVMRVLLTHWRSLAYKIVLF